MVLPLVAFVVGVALLQQTRQLPSDQALLSILAAALGVALLAAAARRRHGRVGRAGACVFAALVGLCYAAWIARERLSDELSFADEGRNVEVTGIVAGLPTHAERGVRFAFEVEQAEPADVHVPRLITLAWYRSPDGVRSAQRWRFTVRLRRPHGTFNPAGFDTELWMLEQGTRATGYVRDGPGEPAPRCLQQTVWRLNPIIDRLRDGLRQRLQQVLQDRRYGGVIVALVMGDQGLIAQSDWTLFNRTGISQLVSISGLHITMIAALVALAAGACWRCSPRLLALSPVQTVRALAGACAALAYCLLAGWGVPAQRTFVMLTTVALALVLRVRLSAATVLCAAAALVCAWDPWAVMAAGFWLSFGAVACIFLVLGGGVPARSQRHPRQPAASGALSLWRSRLGEPLREAGRVQAAVTLGLVPLTLVLFQQISLISPIANAVAIPVVSYLVTPLALAGALACCLGDSMLPVAQFLLSASHALFELLVGILNGLVRLPYAWIGFAAPPAWTVAAAGLGIFWMLAPAGWPLRWVGAAWLVPALVWPPERPGPGALWVTAMDVGQGMALVLESAQHTLVFDTGPRVSEDSDAGARVIVPYLRARGIDRVALLVISHLDSDHSGGAPSLMAALKVDRVLTSIDREHEMLRSAPDVQRCETGQRSTLGPLQLTVLNPAASLYDLPRASTNSKSCVVLAQLGATRALLTGDVPLRQEAGMVASFGPDLGAQLLVAPHHGSRTSSGEAFVGAVGPRWVSVQAGYRSRFGHPHPEVLARYRQHGAQVVRSDWSGASRWRFEADGSVRLEQWRLDHARYWLNQPSRWAQGASRAGPDDAPG